MSARAVLASSALFRTLDADVIEEVARFMTPVSFEAGDVVFRQGDRGDRLIVVAEGELEVWLEIPGGDHALLATLGPGHVVGELALLGGGRRTATVSAVTATRGWSLARSAFDILRHDIRPAASQIVQAIGHQAVRRLDGMHRRCAAELDGERPAPHHSGPGIGEVSRERDELAYLAGTLFFQGFSSDELRQVTTGMTRLAVPRGAVLNLAGRRPSALWIVVRGAIETSMPGSSTTLSLRLAGPGRAIGHVGLLGEAAFVDRIESRARERSIVLEITWPRVHDLLRADDPGPRRFAAALWTDVVRALQHGERPLARTRTPFAGAARDPRSAGSRG